MVVAQSPEEFWFTLASIFRYGQRQDSQIHFGTDLPALRLTRLWTNSRLEIYLGQFLFLFFISDAIATLTAVCGDSTGGISSTATNFVRSSFGPSKWLQAKARLALGWFRSVNTSTGPSQITRPCLSLHRAGKQPVFSFRL